MDKPTKEDIKWFWEKCGLVFHDGSGRNLYGWYMNNKLIFQAAPKPESIEFIGFLFRWAVPIITEKYGYHINIHLYARAVEGQMGRCAWVSITDNNRTPIKYIKTFALEKLEDSLYQAIYEVFKSKEKEVV